MDELAVVVVVELVDVDTELLVLLTEVDEVLAEVLDVDVDDRDVLELVVDVLELVELVEVLDVDVELVDELVLDVLVELVLVDVVIESTGNSSPRDSLYTLPTTTAEALGKLIWFIALINGSTALDKSFS